jgi:trimeric autotransporter adhesin
MTRARDLADQADGIIVGDLNVDGGTIKLDGNYPVGTGNVALGDAALDSNVSGGSNVAIGANALTANTADNNTAVGYESLYTNQTGTRNVALGGSALYTATGNYNTAVGFQSLNKTTTGTDNTAIGLYSGYSNTSGANNTALGDSALFSNTVGSSNTAVGYQAGYSSTEATHIVALGYQAAYSNTVQTVIAVGFQAGYTQTGGNPGSNVLIGVQTNYSNVSGGANTIVGHQAGYYNTAAYNTYIGYGAGSQMTTGGKNTIIGKYNGNEGGLDIRTASNNIVLSDGDGNPRIYVSSSGCVSIGTVSTTTDTVSRFGGSSSLYSQKMVNAYGGGTAIYADNTNNQGWIYARFNTNGSQVGAISVGTSSTSYVTSSDYRLKENVVYDWDATTRLKQLKPARFNFIVDADTTVDGFLAHEAQAVVPECVTGTKDAVDEDGVAVMQGIDQSKLVPLLVKTIQELEARITALEGN